MVKRFSLVLALLGLVSACSRPINAPAPAETQPALALTRESLPAATSTPLILAPTEEQVSALEAQPTPPACPGAPEPHIALGQQVTVVVENFDRLKLRSAPEISLDTELMELDKFTQLKILEGPVCVSDAEAGISYWFWKVGVPPGTDIGWVAEGDSLHYFVE